MTDLQTTSEQVKYELGQVANGVNESHSETSESSSGLGHIEQARGGLEITGGQISQSISSISKALDGIQEKTATIGDRALEMSVETEAIYGDLATLSNEPFFIPTLREAEGAATAIAKLIEQAINSGEMCLAQICSGNYTLIPNTIPKKDHRDYDRHTDKHLPTIQEPILARNGDVAYADVVEKRWLFPD